jgi:hypothetical protein
MLRRPLGRPKNRWKDDVRNDMKKLKIKKNWTNCIQDCKNWKLYVGKAKTFRGGGRGEVEGEEEKKEKKPQT